MFMEEPKKWRVYLGYTISGKPVYVSVVSIFTALVCVITTLLRIPYGSTGGYFNFGDIIVMVSGLIFGPWVGAFAGGIGSMISDLIGFPIFAPLTLLAKGLEGFLVGIIANPRGKKNDRIDKRDIIGSFIGGIGMVAIYFVGETFVLTGLSAAIGELFGNFILQCCLRYYYCDTSRCLGSEEFI